MNDTPDIDRRIGELLSSELPVPEHLDGHRERVAALLTQEAVARQTRRGWFPELHVPWLTRTDRSPALVRRIPPRARRRGVRVAVLVSVVAVAVAAVVVGSLEALDRLGRPHAVVRITDDTDVTTGSPATMPVTVIPAGAGTWQEVTVTVGGGPVNDLSADPADPSALYAATSQGLFKSTDAAEHWERLFPGFTYAVAVDPASPAVVYACVDEWQRQGTSDEAMVLVRSDDRGASWKVLDEAVQTVTTTGVMGKAWMFLFDTSTSPSTVYYYAWGLRRSVDRGETWTTLIPDDTQLESVVLDPAHPGTVYATYPSDGAPGSVAELQRSTDGGSTWETLSLGITGASLGRLALDPKDGSLYWFITVGDAGAYGYAVSRDQGQNWTVVGSDAAERAGLVLDVRPGSSAAMVDALSGPMTGLAAIGGKAPVEPYPWGTHVVAVITDRPTLYFFGDSGVYRSTDSGASWAQSNLGLSRAHVESAVVGPNSGRAVYAISEVGILRSGDGGVTWSAILPGTDSQLLVAPSSAAVLYVLNRDGLWLSGDGGTSWERRRFAGLEPGEFNAVDRFKLALVAGDDPNVLFAYQIDGSGERGLYGSADGGDTWTPCATGTATVLGSLASAPGAPSVLYAAATQTPQDVYNNAESSTGLVTSVDRGATWTYREAPDGIRFLGVDAKDPSTIYALSGDLDAWTGVLSDPVCYRSDDAGNTWRKIEFAGAGSPEWLTTDPLVPGTLYMAVTAPEGQRTEARIYRSRDGGGSWEDLTGQWTFPQAEATSMWCKWAFAADLIADPASGFAIYAVRQTQIVGSGPVPAYSFYKWAAETD